MISTMISDAIGFIRSMRKHIFVPLFWYFIVFNLHDGLGYLFKVHFIYFPFAYMLGPEDDLQPGTGETPYELATSYVFAWVHLMPLFGMVVAYFSGSRIAKIATSMPLFVYHLASIYGLIFVFPKALNPEFISLPLTVRNHLSHAALFAAMMWAAEDENMPARTAAVVPAAPQTRAAA
jgi:hypothetical protein